MKSPLPALPLSNVGGDMRHILSPGYRGYRGHPPRGSVGWGREEHVHTQGHAHIPTNQCINSHTTHTHVHIHTAEYTIVIWWQTEPTNFIYRNKTELTSTYIHTHAVPRIKLLKIVNTLNQSWSSLSLLLMRTASFGVDVPVYCMYTECILTVSEPASHMLWAVVNIWHQCMVSVHLLWGYMREIWCSTPVRTDTRRTQDGHRDRFTSSVYCVWFVMNHLTPRVRVRADLLLYDGSAGLCCVVSSFYVVGHRWAVVGSV